MRPVRHRDDDPAALPRPLTLEQRGEDLDDGPERASREVGDLRRRHRGSRVREKPRPADVVDVVPGPERVTPFRAEAGDRAVDGRLRDAKPEALEHAGTEAVEYDVGLVAELERDGQAVTLEIALDDLLSGVERLVPGRRACPHRLAARLLDLHDARPESCELPAGERPG